MTIEKEHFGSFEGHEVHLYTLTNTMGMTVKVMNYGATITSVSIAEADGKRKQIACGFDSFEEYHSGDYKSNAPYFGCTVGRYASRIKDGKFTIDGIDYNLACNDGPNHLHGGIKAFDKRMWDAKIAEANGLKVLIMSIHSPHMEEGYPGNIDVMVSFSLTDDNELHINYSATTDMATPLSLTNHTYFNLSGFKNTIADHVAVIYSDRYLKPDETNVPVGEEVHVSGDITDLRQGRLLKDCFHELKTGFEHFYLLDNQKGTVQLAASFKDPASNLHLEILSTEPGALFYTGYFTADALQRNDKEKYGRFKGLCFETGRYPNGPNIPGSPRSITTPNSPYTSTTVYKITNESFNI